ncbi:hypothetical protein EXIGLDRAFT_784159 [Exidia glandulosa HHB12029]|uniref:F-box domain-containing protein n=1 Tax=Exidia glandulosa HHB12029 TaxID=1314781 RepID=A0A166MN56_EXIGL|nr:hypothetical protein EXIGLDRAFT_784159 [Exidia glandulosa HHB12029]
MSNQFLTLNSAADLTSTPKVDYSSVSSVTLRPTPFLTWRDLQTIFSRCPNIRDLTIPSPGFQVLDLPSSMPFAPTRPLHRLSLVYDVGNPLHDTSVATLWALPGVTRREIANVDIKLDWSQSKQGTVEKVLGDLLRFVLSSFTAGIRAAHVAILDRDGRCTLDVRTRATTQTDREDEEVYDFRRTLRLFSPLHTDDTTKARILEIVRTYISYALRAPRTEPHSPKPLSSVSHLRIPLSLVPSLSAHFNPHRPYLTTLEHLELDWDVCPFHTEAQSSIVFPAWTSVLKSITIHAPHNRNVRLPAEGFLALLNLGVGKAEGTLKLKLKGARIATEGDLKRLKTVFGQIHAC